MAMDLGVLKRNFDGLKLLAEKQEQRVRYYETRAQNVAIACLIWDRLFVVGMYHTSSSLSLLNCTPHLWMVLGFSLASTSLYLLFFLEAVFMLYRAQNQLDIISKRQIEISLQILNTGSPNDDEAGDTFSSDNGGLELSFQVQLLQYHPLTVVQRKIYIASTISTLLAVAAFEVYTCKLLLCNSN
ncbi:WD repeat-containing protein 91-like protein [Cucumis melo var. makuwa]|uniref:WD repeat-containing protein 91-like protein n=1 Tax=Cucumis melo var. makuwa TaxID=1194695 RepID=A0A5A7TGW8_CUCMM|nr:WD repeat-containing protein 91-like protein [Cucumis melo var. makuwa]TYK05984.1 WD repeat-containing protein 91-like protein [Cucumis melo var. makuwa]